MSGPLPVALLLDLDGTLVDSEPIHRAAYRAFFAERGWAVSDLRPFTGRRAQDVFAGTPGPWSHHDPLELAAAVMAHVPPDASPEPVAGARRLVEAAADRGVHLAVVTSAGREWAERALADALGVRRHVEVVVTSDDVRAGKPDPAGFALACSHIGVAPSACAAVEDSPAGIAAARAAGVADVFGVATTHAAAELVEAGAVGAYADLDALAARLNLAG